MVAYTRMDTFFVVENSEKSGKINNMYADYFIIRRENPNFTFFNPQADYTIAIPDMLDVVNNSLSDACRKVAEVGTKNHCEVLLLVDLKTGENRFNELGDYGLFSAVEYPYELQKLLVENVIRDFANLGFWEVDGRV